MSPKKRKALEKAGWTIGGIKKLLGLSNGEIKLIDKAIKVSRKKKNA